MNFIGKFKNYFSRGKNHEEEQEKSESSQSIHKNSIQEVENIEENIGIAENANEIVNNNDEIINNNQDEEELKNNGEMIEENHNNLINQEDNIGEQDLMQQNIVGEGNQEEIEQPLNVSQDNSVSSNSNNNRIEEEEKDSVQGEPEQREHDSPLTPGKKGAHLVRRGIKKPKPSFIQFQADLRKVHKKSCTRDIIRFAKDEFTTMSDIQKKIYTDLAAEEMQQYKSDCEIYDREKIDFNNHKEKQKIRRKDYNQKYYQEIAKKKRKVDKLGVVNARPLKKHKPDDDNDEEMEVSK